LRTREVVVVEAVRTPVGNFGGALRDVPVVQLGGLVVSQVLRKQGLRPVPPEANLRFRPSSLEKGLTELEKRYYNWDDSSKGIAVDEVILGNVLQAGQGQNTARQATIKGGLPKEVNAFTVNKICASGLKAISLGAQAIATDNAQVILAGGMESMSNAPYALPRARWGYRMDTSGHGELDDLMVLDGLFESLYGYHMGITAENIAERYGITRREQDEFGLTSHQRARAAIKDGAFREEIVPVPIVQKGQQLAFDTDERPMETTIEKMARLQPAFKKGGTVTAGNASGINDGAAAALLMSEEECSRNGLRPLARIMGYASGALDPAYMGLGPIPAVKRALEVSQISIDDLDLVELNEAFAAQAIACARDLGLGLDITNIYGSGIALGHPIGCTGARIVATLLHGMKQNHRKYGLAALCIGGGQGLAMVFESLN
jgi:acetyl-CoA C-acetyltransferase